MTAIFAAPRNSLPVMDHSSLPTRTLGPDGRS